MSTPTLPIELITDILLRLRVKPLLRFTSVSKSWYSLINFPNFIKLLLSKTLTSGNHPNLLWTIVDNLVSLCKHKEKWNGGTVIKKHKQKSKGGTAINKNEFLSSGFKLRL